jgi:hypothetical protein
METRSDRFYGKISRRKLLKKTSLAALSGLLYMNLPEKLFAAGQERSRVVLIRSRNLYNTNESLNEDVVQSMLDDAVKSLTLSSQTLDAWKKLIKPTDVVGIKTNVWNYLATPPELESAIKKRVLECGVREENMSIDDRGIRDNPVFNRATALINTRPMRTHDWSGVGTCIKNYIQFCENPSSLHPDSCADLAKTWFYPNIAGKTRLNILVMFTPMYHNVGPTHFSKKYLWNYNGLIAGIDPVAVDATGMRIIQAKRLKEFGEDRPINPSPKHIEVADKKYKLGNSDPAKIELIRIGWAEESLI